MDKKDMILIIDLIVILFVIPALLLITKIWWLLYLMPILAALGFVFGTKWFFEDLEENPVNR